LLSHVIGNLLPSAFAVALSPIPIIAVVIVLGASGARRTGPAFALGWIAGLLAVSIIVVLVVGAGGDSHGKDQVDRVRPARARPATKRRVSFRRPRTRRSCALSPMGGLARGLPGRGAVRVVRP
jgi:hypothetical protein